MDQKWQKRKEIVLWRVQACWGGQLFIFAQVLVKAIHDDILTMSFVKEKKRKSYTFSKHIEPHSQTIYVGKKILRKQKST